MHIICAAQAFADEGSVTCFSVFQHCVNTGSVQYYTIKPLACPSASLMWQCQNVSSVCFYVILSNECDNQLYIVMVHLNTALPKQGFVLFFNFCQMIIQWFFHLFCHLPVTASSLEVHIYCALYTHTLLLMPFLGNLHTLTFYPWRRTPNLTLTTDPKISVTRCLSQFAPAAPH